MKNDDVILRGGLRMMMVDDGGGRGVKNGQKSDDVINGRPQIDITQSVLKHPVEHILLLLLMLTLDSRHIVDRPTF